MLSKNYRFTLKNSHCGAFKSFINSSAFQHLMASKSRNSRSRQRKTLTPKSFNTVIRNQPPTNRLLFRQIVILAVLLLLSLLVDKLTKDEILEFRLEPL